MERSEILLSGGVVLHEFHDGDGRIFGHMEVLPDGKARVWQQTWSDRYRPTDKTYPGPISAMRAILVEALY